MKILVVNWQDLKNPLSGGAEVHLHNIFKRLAQKGHKITLLVSSFKGASKFDECDDLNIIRRGNRYIFNYQVPFYVKQLLANGDFDLIIEDINKIPFFLKYFVKKPILGIAHHFFGKVIYSETNPMFATYVYLMEKLLFKLYKDIPFIAVSESTKADMIENGFPAVNIKVVYNGIDLEKFKPDGPKSDIPYIVYLGRLKKYKRVDLFIKMIKLLVRESSLEKLKVEIVGDGDARPYLEKLVRKLELENVINFTGFVSEETKIEKLQKAWVLVNTSPKEGWGIVVMEAQACGTPAVVFDSPGLRESVLHQRSGMIVPFGDIISLKQSVLEIIKNDKLREELSLRAREWAENFSWDSVSQAFEKTLLEFYEQISIK